MTRSVSFAVRQTDLDAASSDDEAQSSAGGSQHSGQWLAAGPHHVPHPLPATESESAAHAESAKRQHDSAKCSLFSLPVTQSPLGSLQSPWQTVQSPSGRHMEGLALCLDNGDASSDDDTLKAFQAISEVIWQGLLCCSQQSKPSVICASFPEVLTLVSCSEQMVECSKSCIK